MSLVEEIGAVLEAQRPPRERARQAVAQVTDDRRVEWLATAVLAGLGVGLAFPGETLATTPSLGVLHTLLGPRGETWLALAMIAVAVARAMALAINGIRGRPTSLVRFLGAAVGVGIFAAFTFAIAWPWLVGVLPAPAINIFTYAALAAADCNSALKAARDAHLYRMA